MQALSNVQWNSVLSSGDRIFVGSNAAVPAQLIDDLIENASALVDLELIHILTLGAPAWSHPKHRSLFKIKFAVFG